MKKSVLFIILLFAVGMTAQAQKFALIDMEYILKNIPAYERDGRTKDPERRCHRRKRKSCFRAQT